MWWEKKPKAIEITQQTSTCIADPSDPKLNKLLIWLRYAIQKQLQDIKLLKIKVESDDSISI